MIRTTQRSVGPAPTTPGLQRPSSTASFRGLATTVVLLATLTATLKPAAAATPLPEKEWTVISLLSANYPTMSTRFADSGSSADVNVAVLHDVDGTGMVSYRMLPDENADRHPPGRCCPAPETDCCEKESLPLDDMGISPSSYIFETDVLDRFLSYVQTHFPARHYMFVLRGQMTGPRFLLHDHDREGGIDIVAFSDLLEAFVRRNGGRKIDVVNFGFCLGMSVDWAYALAPHADYFVSSANYTNTPVALRWRIYRWVRDLITDPGLSGADLSRKMVDSFLEESEYCDDAGHGCSNAPTEPYTSVALDLSRMEEVANASKDVMCELLDNPDGLGSAYESALAETFIYGKTDATNKRPDLGEFFTNLKQQVSDTRARAAIDRFLTAMQSSVVHAGFEAGHFSSSTSGVAGYFTTTASLRDSFGPYQMDSMWKLFMDATAGDYSQPSVSGIAIVPDAIVATQGDEITVAARTESREYGPMCLVGPSEVTWTADLGAVGSLSSTDTNPTVFSANQIGTGSISARYSGMSDEITVSVRAASDPGGGDGSDNPSDGSNSDGGNGGQGQGSAETSMSGFGCSQQQGRGPSLCLLALLGWLAWVAATFSPRRNRRASSVVSR